jgi:hypothetical protein
MHPPTAVTGAPAPSLSVTYRVTAAEAYRVRRMLLPRWITLAIALGIGLFLVAGIGLLLSGLPALGTGFVVGGIAALATRPLMRWWQLRRISKVLAKLPHPVVVTVDAHGFHVTSGQSSSLIDWSDIVSVDLRGDFVWVQGRVRPIYVIPRRSFGDAADVDRFVAAARGYLARPAA